MAASPTHDLLLEIGTEDLPARYVLPLATALAEGLADGLARRGLRPAQVRRFATPRRIAALLGGVPERQPEQTTERLGPALAAAFKDGQPTPAALGFAKSCGVAFEALGQKDGKLHFVRTQPGGDTRALIAEVFEETLKQMDELVPKRMRWGEGSETFVRPVEWLTCLFGDSVVALQRFGLRAGRRTYGHRFHAPEAIELASPASYEPALRNASVWADFDVRRQEVRRQIEALAATLQGHVRMTEDLIDEVTALVERPVAIDGRFETRFLELPPEVIVATVETNQRYFTVFRDAAMTQLTEHFITVSNIESRDVVQVISGNERVVRPRLTDALFFWEQDLKAPLAASVPRLDTVTFQKDLGSIGAKQRRIATLAADIASRLGENPALAERAAGLCKADLVSKMVYEFPELQGLMGGYYAARSGEDPAVAQAVGEHYRPTQQGTPIPSTRLGQILSLADKLDTLAGIFAIGQKPTASKDPYALRRAALGVLRICIEGALDVDVSDLLTAALEQQPAGDRGGTTRAALRDFVRDRLQNYWVGADRRGTRVTVEVFDAATRSGEAGALVPTDVLRRIDAVLAFVGTPEAPALAAANKRVRNILRQAGEGSDAIDPARFESEAERTLHTGLEAVAQRNAGESDYTRQLVNLAALRDPIDGFFEAVMVNADDPQVRANRLALLRRFDQACRAVADLSCLPG